MDSQAGTSFPQVMMLFVDPSDGQQDTFLFIQSMRCFGRESCSLYSAESFFAFCCSFQFLRHLAKGQNFLEMGEEGSQARRTIRMRGRDGFWKVAPSTGSLAAGNCSGHISRSSITAHITRSLEPAHPSRLKPPNRRWAHSRGRHSCNRREARPGYRSDPLPQPRHQLETCSRTMAPPSAVRRLS